MAGEDPSDIDSADSTAIPGKGKDEKTYAPYPQLQALVKGAPDELMSKPRWQRAMISFAGPFVNLIFPILLLTVYFVAALHASISQRDIPLTALRGPPHQPSVSAVVAA